MTMRGGIFSIDGAEACTETIMMSLGDDSQSEEEAEPKPKRVQNQEPAVCVMFNELITQSEAH